MTEQKRAKLSVGDRLFNLAVALDIVLLLSSWRWVRFFLRINQHRGPRVGKGIRFPRPVRVNVFSRGVPAGLIAQWNAYGIPATLGGGGFVKAEGTRKTRWCTFWVSPDQQWVAARHAAALGWATISVDDKRRGASCVDAERGAWRAVSKGTRPRSFTEVLIRATGSMTGILQPYQQEVRQQPGLRTTRRNKRSRQGDGILDTLARLFR